MSDEAKPRGRPRKDGKYPEFGAVRNAEFLARAREIASDQGARASAAMEGHRAILAAAVDLLANSSGETFVDVAERWPRLTDAVRKLPEFADQVDLGNALILKKIPAIASEGGGRAVTKAFDLWDRFCGPPTGKAKPTKARKREREE